MSGEMLCKREIGSGAGGEATTGVQERATGEHARGRAA
jgi:hypothetical protein